MRGFRLPLRRTFVAALVLASTPRLVSAQGAAAGASTAAGASGADVAGATPAKTPPSSARVVTLAEAERAALDFQPQLVVARAATNGADAQAEQARSALLPQVTATASYTRETGNYAPRPGLIPGGTAAPSSYSLTNSFDYWNFGVSGSQLIFDFGQALGRYRAAASTANASRIAERTTLLQVLTLVRRTYFNARAAKDLVDVARQTLDSQQQHLVQVQGFVGVGTQPPIALAQQRAAVATAEVQLITAENNYETAKAQLNQAAGLPSGTEYTVGDDELPPVQEEEQLPEAVASKALASRPELATLDQQREAQERTLRSAQGGYGPALSALAGVSEAGTALDGLIPNWTAELLISWPIFQGGLTTGQVHQAEAGLQSVDAQRRLEELQVRLDVDTARLAVRAAKATLQASGDAVASAHEQLRLAEQRYATGVGNIIELTDAQVSYTSAAAQAVQARYALSSARALLLAALGRT